MPKKKKFAKEEIKSKKEKYIFAVGRRKRSVARVKLFGGKGETTINGKPIEEYFPGEVAKAKYQKPFSLTETLGKYFLVAKIDGGGKSSQLEALVHGLSRALSEVDTNNDKERFRSILKKAKFLRRDPREKERRKPGFAQKARKKKQSPKR